MKTLVFFALAADPLRPSAERARPDDARPLTSPVARRRRRGISFPCRRWSPQTCVGCALRTASPGPSAARAGLGRESETTRDAFRRPGPWSCDRGGWHCANVSERASAFRHRFACCDEARRRPTTRASASRYSADHERLSRDAFAIPAVDARIVNGEGAPHRLLQPTYVTCTCYRSLDSRCARPTFAVRTRPTELPPPARRGVSHLTMRPALRSIRRSRVPPSGGRGRP